MTAPAPGGLDGALVLGLDCSTTAAKALLVDAAGTVVARGRCGLATAMPAPGWHEQDPASWWAASRTAIRDALAQLAPGTPVAALAISHQRESFACLAGDGTPLRPALLWVDSRAGEQVADLGDEQVHRLSGKPPDVTPALYKMAWLRRHEPGTLRSSAHVVDTHGYLVWRLTGRWVTSWASADPLGLVEMARFRYAPRLLALAGLRPEQLPELAPPGAPLGPVRADVAADLGLAGPAGPPVVVAGAGDGQCAGLGADVTGPGPAYLNLGTAVVAGTDADRYRWSRSFRTLASPLAGRYVQETLLSSGSYLLRWYAERFGSPAAARAGTPDPELVAAAAALPPGAEGLLTLPYWNCAQTPYWDPAASGAVLGWRGSHGPAHLLRSLLEGVALELRLQWSKIAAPTQFRAVGGGARDPLWPQLVADVTGVPVTCCAEVETSALGAAALAAAAVGLGGPRGDVRAAAARLCRLGATYQPRPDQARAFDRVYAVYARLYPRLRELFPELARLATPA